MGSTPFLITGSFIPCGQSCHFTNIILVIPGNEAKEVKSLDPFLEVLVDELLGSTMYDAYSGAPFQVKISVLLHYQALGKVMGW